MLNVTVFFCGCSLRCVFCQNKDISHGKAEGREYSPESLAKELLILQDKGVHNINLVTPTHFVPQIISTLDIVKNRLYIPVIYNSSGYETEATLNMLDGYIDIYMPDFKYFSDEIADKYSNASGYFDIASKAIARMYAQVGKCVFSDDGCLVRGVVVRHLCLPSCRHDSMEILKKLSSIVPTEDVLLSLMSQYTPEFASDCEYKNLHRRITTFEYESVAKYAAELGFRGFLQSPESAKTDYTPDFT